MRFPPHPRHLGTLHVDDLIMAGSDIFHQEVGGKLQKIFKFSKVEEKSFKCCGCNILARENGDIEVDQNNYLEKLKEIEIPDGEEDRILTAKEQKHLRGKIGKWISLITRPDLVYEVNLLASEVSKGTVITASARKCFSPLVR